MFFCRPCAIKEEWPDSLSTSYGKCEVCGKSAVCYDVASKYLPEPKPKKVRKNPEEWCPADSAEDDSYGGGI